MLDKKIENGGLLLIYLNKSSVFSTQNDNSLQIFLEKLQHLYSLNWENFKEGVIFHVNYWQFYRSPKIFYMIQVRDFRDKLHNWETKHKIWPNPHLLVDSRRWEEIGEQKKRRTLQNTILGDAVWIFVKIFMAAMVHRVEDKRDYIQVLWWCWDPAGGQTGEVLWVTFRGCLPPQWQDRPPEKLHQKCFFWSISRKTEKILTGNVFSEAHLRKRANLTGFFLLKNKKCS